MSGGASAPMPPARAPGILLRAFLATQLVAGLALGVPSLFGLLWFLPYGGVGSLLVLRRPRLTIGWLVLGIGWALVLAMGQVGAPPQAFRDGTVEPLDAAVGVLAASAGQIAFALFGVLAFVFPSGRLPDGRWRAVSVVAIAAGLVLAVTNLFVPGITVTGWGDAVAAPVPNPAAIAPGSAVWTVVTVDTLTIGLAAMMALGVVSMVSRFRRAAGIERQQLRWLVSALSFVVVAVVGGFVLGVLVPDLADTGLIWLGAIVGFPCVALAIGVAILRYRLYEIDRIVSRTVSWLVVTVVLVAVFAGAVIGLQWLLAPVTEQNTLAVAASTLLAAALFQPLRGRVQRAVDRRFNRARVDAERVSVALATTLRDEVALAEVERSLTGAVRTSLNPTTTGLWLRGAGT